MFFETQEWNPTRALARIRELEKLPGALLPVLHALQEEFGYVDGAAIPLIAEALNISEAEVFGVIGFYHDFRQKPPGKHILKICRAESCQAMGCENLIRHIERKAGIRLGETDRFKQARDPQRGELPGQHWLLERGRDEALGGEVVDLVRLHPVD